MKLNKILIVFLLGMFLVSFASASLFQNNQVFQHNKINSGQKHFLEHQNIKHFKDYGSYEIHKNKWLGLFRGAKTQSYTLLSSSNSIINAYAILDVQNYQPEKLLSKMSFKGGTPRDLKISYWVNESYNEQQYKQVCEKDIISLNGTIQNNCNQVKNGFKTKYKAYWKPYNNQVLPYGDYKIKITAKLPRANQKVDWILHTGSQDIALIDWQWWNSNWNYKRQINLTGNVGQLSYLATIPYSANMNSDFSDLRFVDTATETTEYNYTIESYTASTSAIVRIYSQGDNNVMMYYGNPTATTTSSASNTYFNPVSYYYLDEQDTTGTGTIYDALGVNNGTNVGATNTTGKIGTAYTFDGVNNYINLGTGLPITSVKTISAWFKTSTTGVYQMVVGKDDGTATGMEYRLYIVSSDNKLHLNFGGLSSSDAISTSVVTDGVWHYAVGISDSGNNTLYIDGVLDSTVAQSDTLTTTNSTKIGARTTGDLPFSGTIDEVGIWNKALTATEISKLYNSTAPTFTIGAEQNGVSTTLNSPIDTYNSSSSSIIFNWTSISPVVNLTNTTLYLWDGTGNLLNTTFYSLSGTQPITTTQTETLQDGDYIWNAETCGENVNCSFATINRTLSIDTTKPNITIYAPNGTFPYLYPNQTMNLNFTSSDIHLDSCWYQYNNSNVSVPCSTGVQNNLQFNYQKDNNNLIIYSNDTYGNLAVDVTSWDYGIFKNSVEFNNQTYESQYETYKINLTSNITLSNVYLNYSNNSFKTTNINGVWTYSRDLPFGTVGNNTLNWIITYDNKNYSTNYYYQNVNETVFTICNSNYTIKSLNVSFKDENNLNPINASIPVSTFTYYLGDGKVSRTYTYSNTTNNPTYTFCSGVPESLKVIPYIQYKQGTNYPQRIWQPTVQTYNQTVSNLTLYLLNSINGIYVTYQVMDGIGNKLSGVDVKATREIEGEIFQVGNGQTDLAGGITFWLNPDFLHTITFTKSGYTTFVLSQFPTQALYTVMLGSQSTSDVNDYIKGITYQVLPQFGSTLNVSKLYNFNMTFNSSYWNTSSFGFVLYGDNNVIGANSSTGSNGFISNTLNISAYKHIGMKIYWVINGTTTYGINNGWLTFNYDEGTEWSIWNLFKDLSNYTTEGDGIFGLNQSSLNFIIFLIIFLSVGITSYKFSITSPAVVSGMIFALVFLFDEALNMINIDMIGGIKHFPTIFTLLIMVALIFWEAKR